MIKKLKVVITLFTCETYTRLTKMTFSMRVLAINITP